MQTDSNSSAPHVPPGAPTGALGLETIGSFIAGLALLDQLNPRSQAEILADWGLTAAEVPKRRGLSQEESVQLETIMYEYADAHYAGDHTEIARIERAASGVAHLNWAVTTLKEMYKENDYLAPGSDPLYGVPLALLRPPAEAVRLRPQLGKARWLFGWLQKQGLVQSAEDEVAS